MFQAKHSLVGITIWEPEIRNGFIKIGQGWRQGVICLGVTMESRHLQEQSSEDRAWQARILRSVVGTGACWANR